MFHSWIFIVCNLFFKIQMLENIEFIKRREWTLKFES